MSLFTTAGGGSTQLDTGYEISNSLRFNDGDSPRLNRTTTTATDDDMATLSVWYKRSTNDANQTLIGWNSGNGAQAYFRVFNSGNNLQLFNKHAAETSTSVITNAKFRDNSAWYHVVLKYDAAQSTASDRVKFYINGEEQTSLGTANYPPQNTPLAFNYGGRAIFVGCWNNSSEFVDGYISEFNYIDGQALAPTEFGETNENGVWIPKRYLGTYGNNGFFLEFQDSGSLGTDTSGNGNNFTATNLTATDQTTDTPTNNFATANPLDVRQGATFADGNLQITTDNTNRNYVISTIGASSGKWYMECKVTAGADTVISWVGVADFDDLLASSASSLGDNSNEVGLAANGVYQKNNVNTASWAGSYTNNDIIGILLDMDNNRVTFHKNGSYADGAGNFDESSPTAYISLTNSTMGFAFGDGGGGSNAAYQLNFGNAPFTISSGNSDANGYGNFEYAVPSGYYALCTKNLAEYG